MNKKFDAYMQNRMNALVNPQRIETSTLKQTISGLYASFGLPEPRIVIVDSPPLAKIVAGISASLLEWPRNLDRTAWADVIASFLNEKFSNAVLKETQSRSMDFDSLSQLLLTKEISDSALEAEFLLRQIVSSPVNLGFSYSTVPSDKIANNIASAVRLATNDSGLLEHVSVNSRVSENEAFAQLPKYLEFGFNPKMESREAALLKAVIRRCIDNYNTFFPIAAQPFEEMHSFARQCASKMTEDEVAQFQLWLTLVNSCSTFWLHEQFCVLSEPPEFVRLNSAGRLHCDDGPALQWLDGRRRYAYRGTITTRQTIEAPHTLTAAQIISERDIEVRRTMISRFGEVRFLLESGSAEVDRDERYGTLFSQKLEMDEPLVMVKVTNSTPEPDGTHKEYFLRVPPHISTAKDAVAWTFEFDRDDYDPSIES